MSLKNKPTLEELLKLKRSERPTDAEWQQFDARLKRKMLCRLVGESDKSGFALSLFGRKTAYVSAALFAFFAAVLTPLYSGLFDTGENFSDSNFTAVKSTPLPQMQQTFATNVFAADSSSEESPITAPMNFSEANSVRYLSNEITSSNSPAF